MIKSRYSIGENSVKSEITFVPQKNHIHLELRCEVYNEAMGEPKVKTIEFVVTPSKSSSKIAPDIEIKSVKFQKGTNSIYDFLKNYRTENNMKILENYDEDDDYVEDENYLYEYPQQEYDDSHDIFNHPELQNENLFQHKLNFSGLVKIVSVDHSITGNLTKQKNRGCNLKIGQNLVFCCNIIFVFHFVLLKF